MRGFLFEPEQQASWGKTHKHLHVRPALHRTASPLLRFGWNKKENGARFLPQYKYKDLPDVRYEQPVTQSTASQLQCAP